MSDDFHVWATGGLETLLFTLLTSAALLWLRLRPASLDVHDLPGLPSALSLKS